MDRYPPNSALELWVIGQAKNLVSPDLVGLKHVIVLVHVLLVDTNVQVWVRLRVKRPRINLYHGGRIYTEVEIAVLAPSALEVNGLHVLQLHRLGDFDTLRHLGWRRHIVVDHAALFSCRLSCLSL